MQPLPLEKTNPLFSSNLPLKIEVLSSPLLFENLVAGSTPPPLPPPPAERGVGGGGAHYDLSIYPYKYDMLIWEVV